MPTLKLGRKALSNLPTITRPTIFYDAELKGFGLKALPPSGRHAAGSRSWIVEYRPGSGGRNVAKRRVVLGSPETLSPETAREAARVMLARVRLGEDPAARRKEARIAQSIAELEPLYSADTNPLRKPRTVVLYMALWKNHLIPAFGPSNARDLKVSDVLRFHRSFGQKHPSTANRTIILLSHFFRWAQQAQHVAENHNPARGIQKFKERGRERYLASNELSRLGAAIRLAETEGVPWRAADPLRPNAKHTPKRPEVRLTKIDREAAAALRLLIFTGARLREILHLRWREVDLDRGLLLLSDSKTGKKTIVLGSPAIVVLSELKAAAIALAATAGSRSTAPLSEYVFPSMDDLTRPKADLKRPWATVIRAADLPGLRLHDLRHSFASVGAGASMGLPVIGKLLGHADVKTTARYAHLDSSPLRRASDAIGGAIAVAMGEMPQAAAVPQKA
ncbi:site-specific integrase [Sphingomonas phyllosphaerae]|uniref:site-specific integrase n=1 Tax=Sphingomonas phyllosphaerae TaxID=257003 RepID=UPI0003B5626A|nr:site-specific integrase [Sphingomonas phyllosphaerae]